MPAASSDHLSKTWGLVKAATSRRPLATGLGIAHRIGQALVPPLLALLVFAGGLVLLISGALPPAHGRMHPLHGILPLPFVEGSHFAASLVGTALLGNGKRAPQAAAPAPRARSEPSARQVRHRTQLRSS